jgi:putative hydrolase of HD superfamily
VTWSLPAAAAAA